MPGSDSPAYPTPALLMQGYVRLSNSQFQGSGLRHRGSTAGTKNEGATSSIGTGLGLVLLIITLRVFCLVKTKQTFPTVAVAF